MLSYLEKYNSLPKNLKKKVSSPAIMNSIVAIEKEYDISLAVVIMRVMVKEVSVVDLAKFFVFEYGMGGNKANKLVEKLKEKVFCDVFKYLNIEVSKIDEAEKAARQSAAIHGSSYFEKKKVAPPVQSSNFFFSSEDEDEIKALTNRLEDFGDDKKKAKQDQISISRKIAAVIKEANLSFSSSEMNDRFIKILDIYIKKVRNRIDTKQTMMKLVSSGGLGVGESVADKILGIVDKIKLVPAEPVPKKQKSEKEKSNDVAIEKEMEKFKKLANQEDVASSKSVDGAKNKDKDFDIIKEVDKISSGDVEYDFSKLADKDTSDHHSVLSAVTGDTETGGKDTKPLHSKNDLVIEAIQDDTEEKSVVEDVDIDEQKMVLDLTKDEDKKRDGKVKDDDKRKKSTRVADITKKDSEAGLKINRPTPISNTPAPDGKVKMDDVKYVPKLMGPIDELGEMNLVNFRRLSQDSKEATKKIEEKIKFLEDDRYSKRIEGIKAWRSSPINKLYLEIGQEGIIVARGIENAIKAREKSNKDYLKLDEFNAIMELNKRIRY